MNHSHTAIHHANTDGWMIADTVTTTDPTHTTNMTGLRNCVRGSSLRNASGNDTHNCWG